jgi:hypothetical protein
MLMVHWDRQGQLTPFAPAAAAAAAPGMAMTVLRDY